MTYCDILLMIGQLVMIFDRTRLKGFWANATILALPIHCHSTTTHDARNTGLMTGTGRWAQALQRSLLGDAGGQHHPCKGSAETPGTVGDAAVRGWPSTCWGSATLSGTGGRGSGWPPWCGTLGLPLLGLCRTATCLGWPSLLLPQPPGTHGHGGDVPNIDDDDDGDDDDGDDDGDDDDDDDDDGDNDDYGDEGGGDGGDDDDDGDDKYDDDDDGDGNDDGDGDHDEDELH